jgi:hypothetical protein
MLAAANLKFNSIQFIKNLEWQSTQTLTEKLKLHFYKDLAMLQQLRKLHFSY